MQGSFDRYFEDAFEQLLRDHYGSAEQLSSVSWSQAEEAMRRHQVTGGLTPERRRQLFEEHRSRLLVDGED